MLYTHTYVVSRYEAAAAAGNIKQFLKGRRHRRFCGETEDRQREGERRRRRALKLSGGNHFKNVVELSRGARERNFTTPMTKHIPPPACSLAEESWQAGWLAGCGNEKQ